MKESFRMRKLQTGGFNIELKPRFDALITGLKEGEYLLTIQTYYPDRTLKQNAYLHAIFTLIGRHTGHTPEEIKEEMKRRFAVITHSNIFSGETETIIQSTAAMDTAEMSRFVDKIKLFAAEFLSLDIPDANNRAAIDGMLE